MEHIAIISCPNDIRYELALGTEQESFDVRRAGANQDK